MSGFSREIKLILDDYAGAVTDAVNDAVVTATRSGAKQLRAASAKTFPLPTSHHKRTDRYAKGWKARIIKGKRGAEGTIYNATVPGLPHLLEHGHANRNGGRTPGHVHIKPVEEQIIKEFEAEVRRKL